MIHPLRQRHRHIIIALGILLPVAFAAGIAARKPLPEVNTLPDGISPPINLFAAEVWSREDLFYMSPVRIRLLREQSGTGKFAVTLAAAKDFVKPELLVYWLYGNPSVTNALPHNAILLGSFTAPQLPLPAVAEKTNGLLVLYSLADNQIVDVSKPIHLAGLSK
ncbi:MAG: hypothetical protein P4N60_02380 [Verrucomicrobiae bacterium]|nr:hypothetical protein [Verrucomicrobiae bacterium]